MKYQGFYDSVINVLGEPDRPYTAKDFCNHLKALIGNGIGITNVTGDDAWKVVKTSNLGIKVTLGDNNYNFASIQGNPFAVDEELTFTLSTGTDRWDSVVIRSDASSSVRATDVYVKEGNINIVKSSDQYELRLARIHVVNNVITQVIDDRFDYSFCGITNGLATVPVDELRAVIQAVEDESIVAFKDGTLQSNLNAEKLGGKTLAQILLNISESIVTGSFSMTTEEQTINLGFTPRVVIISSGATYSSSSLMNQETEMVTTECPTYFYKNTGDRAVNLNSLSLIDNGFKVQACYYINSIGSAKYYYMQDAHEYGTGYRYIAFR